MAGGGRKQWEPSAEAGWDQVSLWSLSAPTVTLLGRAQGVKSAGFRLRESQL